MPVAVFKVGCVATPPALTSLCPFLLLGITVTISGPILWGILGCVLQETKGREDCDAGLAPFPSSSLKYTPGTFSLHNTINLSLHKGGPWSYSGNSWLSTLLVPTWHCQVWRDWTRVDKHRGHVSCHLAPIHPTSYSPNHCKYSLFSK